MTIALLVMINLKNSFELIEFIIEQQLVVVFGPSRFYGKIVFMVSSMYQIIVYEIQGRMKCSHLSEFKTTE